MNRSIYLRAILLIVLVGFMGFVSAPRAEAAANPNGAGGQMPAFYDGQQFTINFKEQPSEAEEALLAHNGSINTIYMCDQCEAHGFTFMSVIDAIQGEGFNPLWREVQITFNAGQPFQQFTSDDAIQAAKASGEITLTKTMDVYRCSVVGSKKGV